MLSAGSAAALALVVSACSGETSTPDSAPSPEGDGGDQSPGADLTLATTALGIETLVVATYDTAAQAVDGGSLGVVPPAVGQLLTTVHAHHITHRDAWAELVGDEESPAPGTVLDAMEQRFTQQAAGLADPDGLTRLTLDIEQSVADTYFFVIPSLTTEAVLGLASRMLPVDSQHAAVARFLLGQYPVPDTFLTGAQAFGQAGG